MNYNWNWGIYLEKIKDGDVTYLHWLMVGLGWTLAVAVCAWVIAFVIGSVMGTLRTVPNKKLAFMATCWVELFRNVPILVQLFIWFFVRSEERRVGKEC